jgi:hypothetical protein
VRLLTIEYDCGTSYELQVPRELDQTSEKMRKLVLKDMEQVLHARHDRACEFCVPSDPS